MIELFLVSGVLVVLALYYAFKCRKVEDDRDWWKNEALKLNSKIKKNDDCN